MAEQTPVYIKEVGIKDYKCFKGEHNFSFVDDNGDWCRWTVFLGDNNTGKTNLLKAIAGLEPKPITDDLVRTRGLGDRYLKSPFRVKLYTLKLKLYPINNTSDYDLIDAPFRVPTNHPKKPSPSKVRNLEYLSIYGYGVVRNIEQKGISDADKVLNADNLLNNSKLINFEEWLFQLDYAAKNKQEKAGERLELLKKVLASEIFPEINDIRFISDKDFKNYISYQTTDGWRRLAELGYGYQATLSWIADFCKNCLTIIPTVKTR